MSAENIIHEKTREIKKELRLAMNGVVSSLQRNQGLNYKINFGVEIPRLRGIAAKYDKEETLALKLWQDNIRECKILATLLLPQDSHQAIAEQWIAEAPFTEIADHLAMTILCKLPDATTKALEWIGKNDGMFRYCGFLTLSHIFRSGNKLNGKELEHYLNIIEKIDSIESRRPVIVAARNSFIHYNSLSQE